ncbi:MAG: ABC transporter ATP-binding protein [Geminicoccales bacterium]
MLEVAHLHAGYGAIPVLAGISLEVADGGFVGILGHNGMGKTTLLKALIGILPATAGSVRLAGEDVTRLASHERARRGLGYVPQGREIFPALSVMDNLRFAAAATGNADRAAIGEVLDEFPRLRPLLERPGGALSGGEQQLLALARCLVQKPRLVLLDEPTEGIQPSIIEQIADKLGELRRTRGLTVILVEQNLDFIRALSDRVLIIQKGRIVREVEPAQLDDPAMVSEFIGAA